MGSCLRVVDGFRTVALAVVLAAGLAACESKPRIKPMDLGVRPDASLQDGGRMGKVEIDLVAVGDGEKGMWESKSLNDYFSGDDALRRDSSEYRWSRSFVDGDETRVVLRKSDPIWAKWRASNRGNLYILANSRALAMEASRGQEVRRRAIPLFDKNWSKVDAIEITIRRSGIGVNPEPVFDAK
ncbi:MAG: hypothetical protein KF864_07265 [Phycisphaeraceae bacterium]|nr:hypothetical protein [Phycisphaeraceae bacterium]MBX3408635.1 hypothetical protein [Phycisphaeraceae bacterium]